MHDPEAARDVEPMVMARADTDDEGDGRDSDSFPVATAVAPVESFGQRRAQRVGPVQRGRSRLAWSAAIAGFIAATWLCALAWPELVRGPAPTAPEPESPGEMFSINRSVQFGELTVIISHGQRLGALTRFFVHLVNDGEQPVAAALAVGDDDDDDVHVQSGDDNESDAAAAAGVVPANSTRHRVITVENRDSDDSISIKVYGQHAVRVPVR